MMGCEVDDDCIAGTVCTGDGVCVEGVVPPSECVAAIQRYQLRVGEAFALVGDRTGYLHGRTRDEAYRMVQRNAMRAWQEERSFRELLAADPEVTATLDASRLEACFDLKRSLANINRVFDALDDLGELPA